MKKTQRKSGEVQSRNIWDIPLAQTTAVERDIMKQQLQTQIADIVDVCGSISKENFATAWELKSKLKRIKGYEKSLLMKTD